MITLDKLSSGRLVEITTEMTEKIYEMVIEDCRFKVRQLRISTERALNILHGYLSRPVSSTLKTNSGRDFLSSVIVFHVLMIKLALLPMIDWFYEILRSCIFCCQFI